MPENVLDSGLQLAAAGPSNYDLLKTVNFPRDLRALDERRLKQLAQE